LVAVRNVHISDMARAFGFGLAFPILVKCCVIIFALFFQTGALLAALVQTQYSQ
jgi:hypothetical protein